MSLDFEPLTFDISSEREAAQLSRCQNMVDSMGPDTGIGKCIHQDFFTFLRDFIKSLSYSILYAIRRAQDDSELQKLHKICCDLYKSQQFHGSNPHSNIFGTCQPEVLHRIVRILEHFTVSSPVQQPPVQQQATSNTSSQPVSSDENIITQLKTEIFRHFRVPLQGDGGMLGQSRPQSDPAPTEV